MIDVSFGFVAVLVVIVWMVGFALGYVCGRYGSDRVLERVKEVNDD